MSQEKTYTHNLDPNIQASLAYLIPPFTGIAFLIMEKESRFVRFHALQAVLFGVVAFCLFKVAALSMFILIGFIIGPVLGIGLIGFWPFTMWKAFNNVEYQIPFIGSVAHRHIYKL